MSSIKDVRKVLHNAYKKILELEKEVNDEKRKRHFSRIRYLLLWLSMIPCDGRMKNFILPDYRTIAKMKASKMEIKEVKE